MKDNNEDPIKEYKTFRPGLDNLTEDEDIDFGINTYSASKGYHECSDDLSDRGSKIEEIAHAKYAEYKRRTSSQNKYNNYNTYNRTSSSKVIVNGKNKWVIYFLVFFFIIMPIVDAIFGAIGIFFSDIFDDSDYSSSYNYEYIENTQDFEALKEQIKVEGMILSDKSLLIGTSNGNGESISNVQVQVIFYNGAKQPIKVDDYIIDNLSASGQHFEKLYDIPENFETYDFAVTQPYNFNTQEIDFSNIDVNLVSEKNNYLDFEIINNTEDMIDTVEIGILFLKENKVVDFQTERVYDLKSGKTKSEESYQFLDKTEYDRIDYFVNDVYSYNY